MSYCERGSAVRGGGGGVSQSGAGRSADCHSSKDGAAKVGQRQKAESEHDLNTIVAAKIDVIIVCQYIYEVCVYHGIQKMFLCLLYAKLGLHHTHSSVVGDCGGDREMSCRQQQQAQEMALVVQQKKAQTDLALPSVPGGPRKKEFSAEIAKRLPSQWPRPKWRAPWKNYRVISGHLG